MYIVYPELPDKTYVVAEKYEIKDVVEWCKGCVEPNNWQRMVTLKDGSEIFWFRNITDFKYFLIRFGDDEVLPYSKKGPIRRL